MHLNVDIEYIIFKIYQFFHIYMVLSEQLKEYCDFVDTIYIYIYINLFPLAGFGGFNYVRAVAG
jgi:hypothetical protein